VKFHCLVFSREQSKETPCMASAHTVNVVLYKTLSGHIYSSTGFYHMRPIHPHTFYFIFTACWTMMVRALSVVRATLALALFTELATPFLSCLV